MKQFAAEIERDVLGIHNAFDETQPFRKEMFGLVFDQHSPTVERETRVRLAAHFKETRLAFGKVEEGADVKWNIRFVVKDKARSVERVRYESIKFIVFDGIHLFRIHQPQRLENE